MPQMSNPDYRLLHDDAGCQFFFWQSMTKEIQWPLKWVSYAHPNEPPEIEETAPFAIQLKHLLDLDGDTPVQILRQIPHFLLAFQLRMHERLYTLYF